jgi:outer membrane lipoprotein-sorting protein
MKIFTTILILALSLALFSNKAEAAPKKMVAVILLMENDDDQQVIETIYTSLMAAEKVAQVLNIEMVAQEEVNDDVFVFSLKSEEQKELTMKMFDEEGYELAAHRVLKVEDGENYRALNVNSLEDGTYTFQLTDENGAELKKKVTVKKKEN